MDRRERAPAPTIKDAPFNPSRALGQILDKDRSPLDLLPEPQQRRQLADWYIEHLNELDSKTKTTMLEEFIGHDLLDDEQSFGVVSQMSTWDRIEIGTFIGLTVKGTKYLKTFHRCWFDLAYETPVEGKKEKPSRRVLPVHERIIKRYLEEDPESVAMIAPFVKLDAYPAQAHKSIEVLEAMMSAYDMVKLEDVDESAGEVVGDRLREAVRRLPNAVLLPYIPKLVEINAMTRESAVEMLESSVRTIGSTSFLTDEERLEQEQIRRELAEKKIIQADDPYEMAYYTPEDDTMRKLWMRYSQIDEDARARRIRHVFKNFVQLKVYVEDPVARLSAALEAGAPVFAAADLLDMSNEELAAIARTAKEQQDLFLRMEDLSDAVTLLRLQRARGDEKPNLEDLVLRELIDGLRHGIDSSNGRRLILHAQTIFQEFSERARAELLEHIRRLAPELWLLNLRYAIDHKTIALGELMSRAKDKFGFDSFFNNLWFEMHQAAHRGVELDVSPQDAKATLKDFFLHHPDRLFATYNQRLTGELFDRGAVLEIGRKALRPPVRRDVFRTILESSFASELKNALYEALERDPLLFADSIDYHNAQRLLTFLGVDEFIRFLSVRAQKVDLDDLFHSTAFLLEIQSSSRRLDRVLEIARESGKAHELVELYNTAQLELLKDRRSPESKKMQEKLRLKLNRLEGLLASVDRIRPRERKREKRIELQNDLEAVRQDYEEIQNRKALSPRARRELERVVERVRSVLLERAQEEPEFVFEAHVAEVLDTDAYPFIERGIDSYARRDPRVLTDKRSKFVELALEAREFRSLVERHLRTLVFAPTFDIQDVVVEARTVIRDRLNILHPRLAADEETRLREDYYAHVLSRFARLPFLSLYEKIKRIAAQERKRHGEQLEPKSVNKSEAWLSLTRRAAALNASGLAASHAEEIESLPDEERERVLDVFEFASVFELDRTVKGATWMELDAVVRNLHERIADHLRFIFDLPDSTPIDTSKLDAELLFALQTYMTIKARSEKSMREQMRELVVKLSSAQYESWRQWGAEPQSEGDKAQALAELQEQGVLPRGLTLGQYERWNKEDASSLEAVFEVSLQDVNSSIKTLLAHAVADHHVAQEELSADPIKLMDERAALIAPLQTLTQEKEELSGAIARARIAKKKGFDEPVDSKTAQRYEKLKEEIAQYRSTHDRTFRRLDALTYLRRLERLSVEELQGGYMRQDKARVAISKVFETLKLAFHENELFTRDLDVLEKTIQDARTELFAGGRVAKSRLTLTDRIDGKTYFLIGEKPVPSCQSYQSTMGYCGGLLGSMRDPNVKFVQVYDEQGDIIARAAMRLLSDESDEPQLFLERVYSTNQHPKIAEAMTTFAQTKARDMGIALYGSSDTPGADPRHTRTLSSHGSRSSYVYTDAGGGLRPDGIYEVKAAAITA